MSALDTGISSMIDTASTAVETPTTDSAVETPSTDTTTNNNSDFQVLDASSEQHEEESTEGKETDTHNADGSEKTPEQIEDFKAKAENRAPLPAEVRSALKTLKETDPKYAAVVKQLHGHFERYEAVKEALGNEGPNGLKNFLSEVGVKNIGEARATLAKTQEMFETVKSTDQLLYNADPFLAENVYEDMKANGQEKNYGKVVSNFVNHLKDEDSEAFYNEVSKPLLLEGLNEIGYAAALDNLLSALKEGDVNKALAIRNAMTEHFVGLRNEFSEKSKISKERAAWEAERTSKETEAQKQARSATENSIAESCDKQNNLILGKSLGGFLKLPYFKDFPYESKVTIGNQIKSNLYAALKADKGYQTAMSTFWKGKTLDRAKMEQVHTATITELSDRIVRETIHNMYPNYAKGGSASGKKAAMDANKATAAKAGAQSISSLRPIYVASRPENIERNSVTVGGKTYDSNALQVLQISGKAFVRGANGQLRFVTWRKS